MIGNFFFLNHSYERAIPILEQVLTKNPKHVFARKKLIIAYIETGRLREGYRLYMELMSENPTAITETRPDSEDCPCPNLINQITNGDRTFKNSADRSLVLGIYSCYCDRDNALKYLRRYLDGSSGDPHLSDIIHWLETHEFENNDHV